MHTGVMARRRKASHDVEFSSDSEFMIRTRSGYNADELGKITITSSPDVQGFVQSISSSREATQA